MARGAACAPCAVRPHGRVSPPSAARAIPRLRRSSRSHRCLFDGGPRRGRRQGLRLRPRQIQEDRMPRHHGHARADGIRVGLADEQAAQAQPGALSLATRRGQAAAASPVPREARPQGEMGEGHFVDFTSWHGPSSRPSTMSRASSSFVRRVARSFA